MKKFRSILAVLLLLSLGLSTAACGRKADADEPEMIIASGLYFAYKDVLFFEYEKQSQLFETLHYMNLAGDGEKSAPVYNGEGDDIFSTEYGECLSLLDPEETEKNGGIPILFVASELPHTIEEADALKGHVRLLRYDMATGDAKVLIDDTDSVSEMAICGDQIYYIQFLAGDVVSDGKGGNLFSANYVLSAIPKDGGESRKIYRSKEDYLSFIGSAGGKIYLALTDTQKVVRMDPDGGNVEEVFSYSLRHADLSLKIYGGYLYYETDGETVTLDGQELPTVKFCRLPLKDLPNKTEEDGETVIDHAYKGVSVVGHKVFYSSATEGHIWDNGFYDYSVCREYDMETAQSSVVYDFSDSGDRSLWYSFYPTDNYCVIEKWKYSDTATSETNPFLKYELLGIDPLILDRKTGALRPWEGTDSYE